MHLKILVAAAALLAAAPGGLHAQDDAPYGMCDSGLAPERVLGTYAARFSPFRMTMAGHRSYQGEGGVATVGIRAMSGDRYILTGLPGDIPDVMPLELAGDDEPDWRWSQDERLLGLDSADLETSLGCEIERFPRLVGAVDGISGDADVTFVVRLVVLDDGQLLGQYGWDAHNVPMRLTGSLQLDRQSFEQPDRP